MRVVASYAAILVAGLLLLSSPSAFSAENGGGSVEFGSKGIVFRTADTSSEVKMQFRLQAWSTYNTVSMEDLSASNLDGLIRRARLKFGGHLFDPSIEFKIELGFSRSDIAFGAPDHPNLILDAIGYWRPSKDFKVGFGQTKLPGNRQRVVSSSEMEFPDRTIVNGAFNIDRDGGFFAFWTPIKGSVIVNLAGALTTGEGRNQPAYDSSGMAYTGRVELLPLGAFHDKGDYIEGDLYREPTPKVSLGFTGHYNDRMGRTRGQLGNYLFQNRSATVLYADGLFKWSGLAIYGEWAQRISADPITYNADSSRTRSVFVGTGYMGQISYTFPNMLSIAGRVGYVDAGDELSGVSDYESSTEFQTCLSYYINEHRIKLQFEVGGDIVKNKNTGEEDASFLHGRFNVEVGI